MSDDMTMSQLIEAHNKEADRVGAEHVTSFKSKSEARAALAALQAKPDAAPFDGGQPTGETEESGRPVLIPAGDNSKFATVGKRGPNQGVGAFAKDLIRAGFDNATVLKEVLAKFPDAKTSKGCIAYYRAAIVRANKAAGETPAPSPVTEGSSNEAAPAEDPALV